MKRAVDRDTREYQELYFFLLKTFMSGDVEGKGIVTPEAFDIMIEEAAASPRRFGLAPSSEEMFKTKEVSIHIWIVKNLDSRYSGSFGTVRLNTVISQGPANMQTIAIDMYDTEAH